jgi:hypothetical protein
LDSGADGHFEDVDFPIRKFETVFGKFPNIGLHHLAQIQNYFHTTVSGFTVQACAIKENRGPCVYIAGFDAIIKGVRSCSSYCVGACDEDIKM